MKNKNAILVVVAVVCGLVAAVLTSQMGAKSKAKVDEVQVVVAAKEIPIGNQLPKDPKELEKWVKLKSFPRDSAPQQSLGSIEEMNGKYVMNRTYRENEPLNPLDVSPNGVMAPPEGFGMMSIPSQPDAAVSGFIRPGTHVDVWASVQKRKSGQWVAFPMFLDMLVLAVNQDATGGGAAGGMAYQGVSMVSLAVKPEHIELFQLGISRGAQMRFVMRHPEKGKESLYEKVPDSKNIREIFYDRDEEGNGQKEKPPEPVKPETVKIKVATKDIVAQTEITPELIAEAFKDVEIVKEQVPTTAIQNLSEHVGRFLQKDLAQEQFVPRNYLGAKKVEEAPKPMIAKNDPEPSKPAPGPGDQAGPKPELEPLPVLPKSKPKPKVEYVYLSQSGVRGTVWYKFEKLPNGELKKIGAVKPGEEEASDEKPKAEDKPSRELTP